MRDDSTMLLLQTPNRLSLGESPVVDAKSHSTQFSRPAETTKSTLSPISDCNEGQFNYNNIKLLSSLVCYEDDIL